MNVVRSVVNDFITYFNPKTRTGLIRLGIAVAAVAVVGVFAFQNGEEATPAEEQVRGVQIEQVGSFGTGGALTLVGTVKAVDQATLQAEAGGRVTAVRVGLGDTVRAGSVIATLENSSQYAAVLQAEGSYEAALAAAAQSDIGVDQSQTSLVQAKNNAVSVVRGAYNTANSAVRNNIDTFFTSPDAQFTPGLRLEGYGYTSYLNNERVSFQNILTQWRGEADTLDVNDDLTAALSAAEQWTERIIEMVETFIVLLNDQPSASGRYTSTELASYSVTFSALRAELNATLLSIENARTTLQSAEEGVSRAKIGGTGGTVSAANASVKQALGALRSAQSTYNKTIIRSPITGVVQTLSVDTGDYVSAFTTVATVANQNALEVTTFISSAERERIAVGDVVMLQDGGEGVVVAIAPAVDAATGKIEVKIQSQSELLQNGDVIELTLAGDAPDTTSVSTGPITIPIAAIKVETDRMVVFTVTDENILVAHKVTVGPLLGSEIVIIDGITTDMEIVTDARGLNEGDRVTILPN
ncbi:MAG: HlyD family efflux transporter periplasmic adaptor subunit [Candidatus Paceibacterota bacterium]